ncbi:MAG: hypothetical protein MUO60_21055 [Clostridiaceae bacterium]|nr:hypothetical protein [Clostridiaceae bacterium]
MVEIIIQYILILLLVIGIGYLVFLLKDNDVNIVDDYYGLNYVLLGTLSEGEATAENVKKIIRVISKTVQYVETNYKDMDNNFKEEKAIQMAKNATDLLCLQSNIDDESIKYLVRLAVALLPPTNNTIG